MLQSGGKDVGRQAGRTLCRDRHRMHHVRRLLEAEVAHPVIVTVVEIHCDENETIAERFIRQQRKGLEEDKRLQREKKR